MTIPKAVLWLLSAPVLLAQQYTITTFAGGAPPPTPIAAVNVLPSPFLSIAFNAGNVYFSSSNCVFKVDPNGILTRVAGNSRSGYSGDGGPATAAQFDQAGALAVDGSGNIYVTDNYRVRKISPDGIITTFAGNGTQGFSGDGGRATDTQISASGLAVDSNNNLYILDGKRVRKVTPGGIISTVAGNGTAAYSSDGGLAVNAGLGTPLAIAVDTSANLYVAENEYDASSDSYFGGRVRIVSANGTINTLAGTGVLGYSGDRGPAINAELGDYLPSIAVDASANLYIADADNHRVRKITPDGIINSLNTQDQSGCYLASPGPYVCAGVVAVDAAGQLYIVGEYNRLLQRLGLDGTLTTIAGGSSPYIGDGGSAASAQLSAPLGIAIDSLQNVYIADTGNSRIRKVTPGGMITTVAGNGTIGDSGDAGLASRAQLCPPNYSCKGLAADDAGNLFVADVQRIRKISANGIITTVANISASGLSTDGKNLYIADAFGARILKVSPDTTLTTVAGNGTYGHSGDGGLATNAQLYVPADVAVDAAGNIYIAEIYPGRIRKVSTDGIITTVAGSSTSGYSGDGGLATNAQLANDLGVAADPAGNVYIADFENNCVRKVSTDGIITTIAGSTSAGYSGDGDIATRAQLRLPARLAVDAAGSVYVSDFANNAVRLLQPSER